MKLEKLILGSFASFVEEGTPVGEPANNVGINFFPNTTTQAASWHSLGPVLDSATEPAPEGDDDDIPSPAGGYVRDSRQSVIQDVLKLSLRDHSEPIWRLVWGLKEKAQDGVAATPFEVKDRFIKGWIHFQLRGEDGEDRVVAALYGKMRLDANPTWSKAATKPSVRFEILFSSIASIVPDGIVTEA